MKQDFLGVKNYVPLSFRVGHNFEKTVLNCLPDNSVVSRVDVCVCVCARRVVPPSYLQAMIESAIVCSM